MEVKKYAVLVSNYPTYEKPNMLGFVHSRVRAYKENGMDVDVYKISSQQQMYEFEGVCVICGDAAYIKREIAKNEYNAVLIHFLDKVKINIVEDKKCIIWVHGFEALSWKRRLYNMNLRFPLYIMENIYQLAELKKYAQSHPQSKFIFVSMWMYQVTCTDIKYVIPNYEIIHNYIDSSIFQYKKKDSEQIKSILLIRSFANRKYANDISVKLIKRLSQKDYFQKLHFTIYGDGKHFGRLTKKLKKYKNVSINHMFLRQSEIAAIQQNHGVFLCPTRQDAQGVSMCEAMSSGLVPLTSFNTAIPEFVEADSEGFLCNNKDVNSFIDAYERMYYNEDIFCKMSAAASKRVQRQCSYNETILQEMRVIYSIDD